MTDDAEGNGAEAHGKAAVRALLIERLELAGFVRPRKVTVDVWEAQKKLLAERLAYMSCENLMTLAEVMITSANGRQDWPSEVLVLQFARSIQPPPPAQSRIVTSWFGSVEGPKAVARGDLVELFRFVRRRQVPPSAYEMRHIAEEARDNARRRQLVAEKQRDGVAPQDDLAWLAAWQADHDTAMALVEAGNRKRAGEAAE